nr:hypothetical protein [uncultured Pseudodesulfovibrio sp.]
MTNDTYVKIFDGNEPFLEELSKKFPREFKRSLSRVGWWLRGEVQDAMRSGGRSAGQLWPERSLLARFDPFSRMRGDFWKSGGQQGKAQKRMREAKSLQDALTRNSPLLRRGGKGKSRIFGFGSGRLIGAVRYKVDRKDGALRIGFLNGSSKEASFRLQGARRGRSDSGEFTGSQPVTEKMRRMFWAAGVPLAKTTKVLKQDDRDLIQPVFNRNRDGIHKRLELYTAAYVKGLSGKHANSHVTRRL